MGPLFVLVAAAVLPCSSSFRGVLGVAGKRFALAVFLCGTAIYIFAAHFVRHLPTSRPSAPHHATVRFAHDSGPFAAADAFRGGGNPAREHAEFVQQIMIAAPTTHFVKLAQGIIYRGGALEVVWPQFLALLLIGAVLFSVALMRFRRRSARWANQWRAREH
jgi:ABC-2 type transport system permease protein